MDVVETAQRLADEVLFPAALATDAPRRSRARSSTPSPGAGLYGLAGPAWAGGLDADFETACAVVEALASGCLTTTFVWVQHIGTVLAAASSGNEPMRRTGSARSAAASAVPASPGGAVPGPAQLVARETADGGRSTASHRSSPAGDGSTSSTPPRAPRTAASSGRSSTRTESATLDGRAARARRAERDRDRAARRSARTPCPRTASPRCRRTAKVRRRRRCSGSTPSLALGVACRCCRCSARHALDDELLRCRAELDRLDPETIEAARASAGELALRAAGGARGRTRAAARSCSTTTRSSSCAKRSSSSSTRSAPARATRCSPARRGVAHAHRRRKAPRLD